MPAFHTTGKSVLFPVFVWVSFSLTILAGAAGIIIPSLDFFPALGKTTISFLPWQMFFAAPGIGASIRTTLVSGILAVFGTLFLTIVFVSLFYQKPVWRLFEKILAPVLSIPHAAFAIGFGFLVTPGGWIMRIISPRITGFSLPPDWTILNDSNGLSLAAVLIMKEFPFLLMVTIGALGRLNVLSVLRAGQSMGYQKEQVWVKIIIPMLYPHLRLSVFAIIAYSLSVVDMALIVGPTAPPSLAVYILRWFNDPDMAYKLVAAAGSVFLFFLVALCISGTFFIEKLMGYLFKNRVVNGNRSSVFKKIKAPVFIIVFLIMATFLTASLVLVIWSFAWQWQFPSALPSAWTLTFWSQGLRLSATPLMTTLVTGVVATVFSIILVIGCLEHAAMSRQADFLSDSMHWFLYLPLLLPQISFMAGVHLLMVFLKLDGIWVSVVWAHVLFILPYLFITLKATYQAFDPGITRQAVLLSRSYTKTLFKVKLPMLLRPILFSLAIGFSVSVAQYVPTLLAGAGRYATLTTEVVTLSGGSDRRIIAVYALIQQMLPMIIFALAIMIPKGVYRHKKGMQ